MQHYRGNAVACSKPPALETCSGNVQYLISITSEYLHHKLACHDSKTVPCTCPWLQVSSSTLEQIKKFQYQMVIYTWIGKPNWVMCKLHNFVVTNQELSNTAKLSVFKPVFVPIQILWSQILVTKRVQSQVQAAEMYLWTVHGVTLCNNVHCTWLLICKAWMLDPVHQKQEISGVMVGHMTRTTQKSSTKQVLLTRPVTTKCCWPT